MMFNKFKYTKWYNEIILRAQARTLSSDLYREKHHIVPRSLGGSNQASNLVILTAREHFLCHWLLTKMTSGQDQQKMAYACKRMMHSAGEKQYRYKVNSKLYEQLKISLNQILKNREFTDLWITPLKKSAKRRADAEGAEEKAIRRDNMIRVNKSRKGEKRPWQSGANNHFFGVRMCGADNPFFNKKHSETTLSKLRKPKDKLTCPHCQKIIGGQANFYRWHGSNCKMFEENINS
jgi:hypothetical protein